MLLKLKAHIQMRGLTFALWRAVEGAQRRSASVAHQRAVSPLPLVAEHSSPHKLARDEVLEGFEHKDR